MMTRSMRKGVVAEADSGVDIVLHARRGRNVMSDLDYPDYIRSLERDTRSLVLVDRPTPALAVVRLNDPENQNARSGALTVQLRRALERLVADDDLRVLVLTGEGAFFSVGGDWKLMADRAHTFAERAEGTTGLWKWIRYQF